MPDSIKLSEQPVVASLPDRTRLPVLLHPADEPDERKRNPTVGLRDVARSLARVGPGPNERPDLWKQVRYYLRADRDADQYGGDCFEELNLTLCCVHTQILVEFYRTDSSRPYQYDKQLIAIYDAASSGRVARSASFTGELVPARFVPIQAPEAQYGYVRRDTSPASITNWHVGELSIWTLDGQDQFATAKQAGGPFPAFTGEEDSQWKPAAKPDGVGPNGSTILPYLHTFRYRTRALADQYGGETLDQLDYNKLYTHARILVEFYHEDPTDPESPITYNQELTAEYDPTPGAPQGWRTSGGAAADAGRIGLRLVRVENVNAKVVKQYRADQTVSAGDVRYYDDGQGVLFFKARQNAGAPVPAPVRQQTTAYWEPTDNPAGQDLATTVAQHTQQLATLAVQSSQVYGYLDSSEAPVGYASLDDALADQRQKTFMRFNVPSLAITKNNTGAGSFYINGEGATVTLTPNIVYTLPGSDIGSLYLQNFYLEGGRGSRINLLSSAAASTPTALLPRLDGSFRCQVWLMNGGAVLLSGYYLSLNGTGTVYALEPFQADSVAPGVTVIKASAGTVKTVNGTAPDAAGNVLLPAFDVYGYTQAKRQQVFELFTAANQVKAVDVALAGDTSTGIGSRIPDLAKGMMYELVADPDNPQNSSGGMVGTPTWIRY